MTLCLGFQSWCADRQDREVAQTASVATCIRAYCRTPWWQIASDSLVFTAQEALCWARYVLGIWTPSINDDYHTCRAPARHDSEFSHVLHALSRSGQFEINAKYISGIRSEGETQVQRTPTLLVSVS